MLRFRPHHLMCTVGFAGQGYSTEFTANYSKIAQSLRESADGDATWIELVGHTDSICDPCPNRRDLLCTTEQKVQKLDSNHAKVLGVEVGQKVTWREAKQKIVSQVTTDAFHQMCDPCGWKSYGICEKALMELKKTIGVFLVLALLASGSSWSAEQKKAAPKIPKKMAQIESALKAKNWKKVELDAGPLVQSPEWGDYALFALIQVKLKSLDNKSGAVASAKTGLQHTLRLKERFPDSPLAKRANEYLGVFQWELTDAKPRLEGYYLALQWLDSVIGGVYVLTPERLNRFSKTCAAHRNDLCESWVRKLLNQFPKNSWESRALNEPFLQRPLEAIKLPSYPRVSQAYKEPEPDLKAIDAAVDMMVHDKESDGISALKKFLEDFPRSSHRFRAKYWLGDYDSIFEENLLGNYGFLSSLKNGKDLLKRMKELAPAEIKVQVRGPGLSPRELVRLDRADQLFAANALEFTSRELEDVKPSASDATEYLVYLAEMQNRVGNHWNTFGVISELAQRSEPIVYHQRILDMIFPLEGWEWIQKAAQENDLDPVLVLSLVKQESGFYSRAVSPKGATGWMQLMPATAAEVDGSIKIASLSDAQTNLNLGTKYLKQLLDRFHGNAAYALAGYNAGPYAVERWIKAGKPEWGIVEFTDSIPYRETRDYVWSILRNYYWYSSRRIPDKKFPGLDYFWVKATPN